MLRMASVCFSLSLNRLRSRASASGTSFDFCDDLDDFVDVVHRDLEAVEDVLPGLGRVEVELGPPNDHLVAVRDECSSSSFSVHDLRGAIDQRQHDHAEGGLHGGVLVELVQDHVGDRSRA